MRHRGAVATGAVWTLGLSMASSRRRREVRSAVEWAQVRALAADGVSQREIARRLGIDRRTVGRLAGADAPPRYERAPAGSMLDPLEPVIRRRFRVNRALCFGARRSVASA